MASTAISPSSEPVDPTAASSESDDFADRGGIAARSTGGKYYDDVIVRRFAAAAIFWALVVAALGMVSGWLMIAPTWSDHSEVFAHGRMRPVHTNLAMFGLLANAVFMFVYHSTQRLCRRRMMSDGLARMHFWSWQVIVAVGAILIPMGWTQSKEYAEFIWPIDVALWISWSLLFGVNYMATVLKRRTEVAYISLWFYGASIVVIGCMHLLGSFAVPLGEGHSRPLVGGAADALGHWMYGQNLIAFLASVPWMGALYYYLPKAAGRPLHSYPLAILHFWSLVLLTLWAGPFHLHLTALPDWASSLGMVFGLAIWMPAWAGVYNGWKTLSSADANRRAEPACRFFRVAIIAYGVTIILGTLQAIKSFQAMTHYTDFVIAYVHTATMGFCGMMMFGVLYWLMPRLWNRRWHSRRGVTMHYWLSIVGILLYVLPLYWAGFRESRVWLAMDEIGNLAFPDFAATLDVAKPMWHARLLGGSIFAVGLAVLLWNVLKTWSHRDTVGEPIVAPEPMAGGGGVRVEPPRQPAALAEVPMLEVAKRMERLGQMTWHRRYEIGRGRMMAVIVAVMGLAVTVQWLPMVWATRPAGLALGSQVPWTPLELYGRDIYIREGCVGCHSQMVRPLVAEAKRYGAPITTEETVFERPFLWGSRRVGPDLGREGGLKTSLWHWNHFMNPRAFDSRSVMPSMNHWADRPIDEDWLLKLAEEDAAYRGVPTDAASTAAVGDNDRSEASDPLAENEGGAVWRDSVLRDAAEQAERVAADIVSQGGPISTGGVMTLDSSLTALIAYVQRLGVDPATLLAPKTEAVQEDLADAVAEGSE